MRILLVNPWITDFKAYDEWMRPLPLYRFMETHSLTHDVALIDCLSAVKKPKRYGTADFESEEIENPEVFRTIPRRFILQVECFSDYSAAFTGKEGRLAAAYPALR